MVLIHQGAINALQEYFVGTTLAVVGREFEAEGIACDQAYSPSTGGQRRTLFQQYMHSVDLSKPRDARRVLNVFANVLGELEAAAKQDSSGIDRDDAGCTFDAMCRLLKRDGYAYGDGRVTATGRSTGLDELQDAISPLDLPHLQQQIERMREATDADPWLAIGTAKERVETTCKTLLRERGVSLPGKPEIPELLKATRESSRLMPDQVPARSSGC